MMMMCQLIEQNRFYGLITALSISLSLYVRIRYGLLFDKCVGVLSSDVLFTYNVYASFVNRPSETV